MVSKPSTWVSHQRRSTVTRRTPASTSRRASNIRWLHAGTPHRSGVGALNSGLKPQRSRTGGGSFGILVLELPHENRAATGHNIARPLRRNVGRGWIACETNLVAG